MSAGKSAQSPHQKVFGTAPRFVNHLQTFGEMGVVAEHTKKIRSKLADRGKTCIFVGYANRHAGEVYRMYDIKTNKVITTRDVTWLKKMYREYAGITASKIVQSSEDKAWGEDDDEDDDGSTVIRSNIAGQEMEAEEPPADQARATMPTLSRTERLLRELNTSYNPTLRTQAPSSLVEDVEVADFSQLISPIDSAFMHQVTNTDKEPSLFPEAWNHRDELERNHWREAIKKEIKSMIEKKVWRGMSLEDVPAGRTPIGSKWVFKKKKNGVYRARLVALGYNQVAGVDYTASFAPVVHDATYRIMLVLWS